MTFLHFLCAISLFVNILFVVNLVLTKGTAEMLLDALIELDQENDELSEAIDKLSQELEVAKGPVAKVYRQDGTIEHFN